jgi:hypothetical protein
LDTTSKPRPKAPTIPPGRSSGASMLRLSETVTILFGLSRQRWFGRVRKVKVFEFLKEMGNKSAERPTGSLASHAISICYVMESDRACRVRKDAHAFSGPPIGVKPENPRLRHSTFNVKDEPDCHGSRIGVRGRRRNEEIYRFGWILGQAQNDGVGRCNRLSRL